MIGDDKNLVESSESNESEGKEKATETESKPPETLDG